MTNTKDDDHHASPRYWLEILSREFQGESDRACVILSATLLDTALEALLRARFLPNAVSTDSLLDGSNAPLASFSARIDMAYRLGLISAKFARDLHIIRRIRNDFAHNISGCTFEDTSVRDRVMALSQSSGTNNCHESWVRILGNTPKGHFELIVGWMLWTLRALISTTSAITDASEEWGYKKDWRVSIDKTKENEENNSKQGTKS